VYLTDRAVQQATPGLDVDPSLHLCGPQKHNTKYYFSRCI